MAIDPAKQIRQHRRESPFVTDLPKTLSRLAALEPASDPPYLTLVLDLQPEGGRPNRRPGRDFLDQHRDEFLSGFEPHTPAHESLSADLDRIAAFLDDDLDPSVVGLVVVARSASGVFEALPLASPVGNRIATGPSPSLLGLARMAEDEPPYAVLVVDRQEARLSVVDRANRGQALEVEGSTETSDLAHGGWSRKRDQNRAEERLDAYARAAAEEARTTMDAAGIALLVLAGDEEMTAAVRDALHESIRDRVVGDVRLDVTASERDVLKATLPVVEQSERAREAEAIGRIQNGAGPGGGAVTGPVETMTALQAGQVMTLVMNDDFAAAGWADFSFPVYGAGEPPSEHPTGGDPASIVPVPLEEELVRLALLTGAEIQIVRSGVPVGAAEQAETPEADAPMPRSEPARDLDALGGVAALLRFALDEERSTAKL